MIMTYAAMTLWFRDDLVIMWRDGDVVIEHYSSDAVLTRGDLFLC